MKRTCLALLLAAATALVPAQEKGTDARDQWPQWRGPLGTGVAPHADPPVEWGEDKNVRWKTPIPGKGLSTPVVWGDRVFITTAIPSGEILPHDDHESHGAHDNVDARRLQKLTVLAIARSNGKILWQTTVRTVLPHESTHATGSWASNSPVTDGDHIYAFFGSGGLYCLDMAGKVVRGKDLGDMHVKHGHGEGS